MSIDIDCSRGHSCDTVDSLAERFLRYPVQSSDSTDVKCALSSEAENESSVGSLDSGIYRCVDISIVCFHYTVMMRFLLFYLFLFFSAEVVVHGWSAYLYTRHFKFL